ncbi:MAG: exonuclease [Methanobacteriota archaeon]|nr:MAG: exonuclease [Euryarchaeota archaeon]
MLQSTFVHAPWIGYRLEARLWRDGIKTWDEFLDGDPRLYGGPERRKAIRLEIERSRSRLRAGDFRYFARRLRPRDQWRAIGEWGDRAVFLDIETTGLRRNRHHVTIVGFHDGRRMRQFIEGVDLDEFPAAIGKAPMVVTFNGSRFDLPFLQSWRPQLRFEQVHADLLYPLHALGLYGGLKEIEGKLGIERSEETRGLRGHDAVRLWRRFERGDEDALDILLEYNRQDVENLRPLMDYAYTALRSRCLGMRAPESSKRPGL